MKTFKTMKTSTVEYDLQDIKKQVLNDHPGISQKQKKIEALQILSKIVRYYRYELLGNYRPFQIINNGYGSFKCLRQLDDDIPARQVFSKLEEL